MNPHSGKLVELGLLAPGLVVLQVTAAGACDVREDLLLADLSTDTVGIDADFSGDHVLFFGATDCPGDVVIVVRGPEQRVVVSRKTRVAGIWVNGEDVAFENVPVFYIVAATRPLDEILPLQMQKALDVGVDNLQFTLEEGDQRESAPFRQALIHNRHKRGLYTPEPIEIRAIGQKLFRTSVWFPPSVPTGEYTADLYYVRGGAIIGSYTLPLSVKKTGFEGWLYGFAHEMPAAYGIVAILAAVFGGWFIGLVFRKARE